VPLTVRLTLKYLCGHSHVVHAQSVISIIAGCPRCPVVTGMLRSVYEVEAGIVGTQFTDGELAIIFGLARKEADRRGYGTTYHEDNRREWPHKLIRLRVICQKIHDTRGK
jgi:hypothetical protein